MAGNVSGVSAGFASSDLSPDFILAACDVEANFIVVKAYQYTNLLSCMLLNSYDFTSQSTFPILRNALEQLGDPVVRVLLVVVHADQVHPDTDRRM